MQAGVIDPTKVTRTALQNAASIASLLLTTECAGRREEGRQAGPADAGRRWRHGRHVLGEDEDRIRGPNSRTEFEDRIRRPNSRTEFERFETEGRRGRDPRPPSFSAKDPACDWPSRCPPVRTASAVTWRGRPRHPARPATRPAACRESAIRGARRAAMSARASGVLFCWLKCASTSARSPRCDTCATNSADCALLRCPLDPAMRSCRNGGYGPARSIPASWFASSTRMSSRANASMSASETSPRSCATPMRAPLGACLEQHRGGGGRVVRDGDQRHPRVPERGALAVSERLRVRHGIPGSDRRERRARGHERPVPLVAGRDRALRVIDVLVRQGAGVDRRGRDTRGAHARGQRARPVAGIDRDAGRPEIHHQRVSPAAAAQHRDLHGAVTTRRSWQARARW